LDDFDEQALKNHHIFWMMFHGLYRPSSWKNHYAIMGLMRKQWKIFAGL